MKILSSPSGPSKKKKCILHRKKKTVIRLAVFFCIRSVGECTYGSGLVGDIGGGACWWLSSSFVAVFFVVTFLVCSFSCSSFFLFIADRLEKKDTETSLHKEKEKFVMSHQSFAGDFGFTKEKKTTKFPFIRNKEQVQR